MSVTTDPTPDAREGEIRERLTARLCCEPDSQPPTHADVTHLLDALTRERAESARLAADAGRWRNLVAAFARAHARTDEAEAAGGKSIGIDPALEVVGGLAALLRCWIDENPDAKNYVSIRAAYGDGAVLSFTVQREGGETPAERAERLTEESAGLRAKADLFDECNRHRHEVIGRMLIAELDRDSARRELACERATPGAGPSGWEPLDRGLLRPIWRREFSGGIRLDVRPVTGGSVRWEVYRPGVLSADDDGRPVEVLLKSEAATLGWLDAMAAAESAARAAGLLVEVGDVER